MVKQLNFDGRVAIVTGGGRGMGREYASLLASRGASVVVNDAGVELDGRGADPEHAEAVVKEIASAGGTATANFGDVREKGTGKALVEQALDEYGRLDIVINNAGILCANLFPEQTDYELVALVEVHLYGTARVAQAAWPYLAKAGYGRIVNTTSSAAFGMVGNSYYGAAKGGIFGLTRTLALEGAEFGIRANCIAPAGWTRMAIESAGDDLLTPEMWEFAEHAMPPAVDAGVVGFLVHQSCQLTGEVLSYSGGRLARWVLSETEGIDVGGELTPEDVADKLDAITSMETIHQFRSATEQLAYTQEKMRATS